MTYTAQHIHQTFPWIGAATLFSRIRLGLLPTIAGGDGQTYEWSFAGVVHVGVIDELSAHGLWRGGKQPPRIQFNFAPAEDARQEWRRSKMGQDTPHERAVKFYALHAGECWVTSYLGHIITSPGASARAKRAERHVWLNFSAKEPQPGAWGLPGQDKRVLMSYSQTTVDVLSIWKRAERLLA